ncbi:MAG: phosphoglycerate kinase [Francisellaceae bacterium]|jgi:phosphoglycerate kinase|nr:phosphoglycerate kinase [Francisellaceae bacterium]MBT6207616.1 phosphoglycerate kinase [Francisellaceae bacterium]MBT6538426.1 phosphoglycerate kinase [Francisellaceae bacterium]
MGLPGLDTIDIAGKKVLLRVDLNVPMFNGKISNIARIKAILPTLKILIARGATVMLLSHLGRPKSIDDHDTYSLAPVAEALNKLISTEVIFHRDWINGFELQSGMINICENVRFLSGETSNNFELSKKMASFADVFVMDAFACAHRAHASTVGISKFIRTSVIGPLFENELENLKKIMNEPASPMVAIIGGAKVSTKFKVLENIITKVDHLIIGGGMANTFLAAQGYNVGNSLYEIDFVQEAKRLLNIAKQQSTQIVLPIDVIVGDELSNTATTMIVPVDNVEAPWKILDIGPESLHPVLELVAKAKTILWNGSLGANEFKPFATGTEKLAKAIAISLAFSVAGGGDTIAAIESFAVSEDINYISTGGGALLEYLEGIELPVIAAIELANQPITT